MSPMSSDRRLIKGFAASLVGLSVVASGCGSTGSKTAATAVSKAPASADPHSTTAGVLPSVGPAKHVTAGGGGDFCKLIASSANNTKPFTGSSPAEMRQRIADVRKVEEQAVAVTPAALKSDVNVLFTATDKVWAALAKANYDYSKIDQTEISSLSAPAVVTAEQHLQAYMTSVCKISS